MRRILNTAKPIAVLSALLTLGLLTSNVGSATQIARRNIAHNHPNQDVIDQLIADGEPSAPWRFVVTSDGRPATDTSTVNPTWCVSSHNYVNDGLLRLAIDLHPKFVLNVGDWVYQGTDADYVEYLDAIDCANVPYLISIVGNHELVDARGPANYASTFGDYDNCFDYGGVRIIYMNDCYVAGGGDFTNWSQFTPSQITWLHTRLTEASCPNYVFIFLHTPPLRSDRLEFDVRAGCYNRDAVLLSDFLTELSSASDAGKIVTVSCHHWQFWEMCTRGNINFITCALGGEVAGGSTLGGLDHKYAIEYVEIDASMHMTWNVLRWAPGTRPDVVYSITISQGITQNSIDR